VAECSREKAVSGDNYWLPEVVKRRFRNAFRTNYVTARRIGSNRAFEDFLRFRACFGNYGHKNARTMLNKHVKGLTAVTQH